MIRLLIQNKANINAVDKFGHTALDAAADATQGELKKYRFFAMHSSITD